MANLFSLKQVNGTNKIIKIIPKNKAQQKPAP
jgi:hypothetical protein